jgi:hypothetical protein
MSVALIFILQTPDWLMRLKDPPPASLQSGCKDVNFINTTTKKDKKFGINTVNQTYFKPQAQNCKSQDQ